MILATLPIPIIFTFILEVSININQPLPKLKMSNILSLFQIRKKSFNKPLIAKNMSKKNLLQHQFQLTKLVYIKHKRSISISLKPKLLPNSCIMKLYTSMLQLAWLYKHLNKTINKLLQNLTNLFITHNKSHLKSSSKITLKSKLNKSTH